jgi:murein DD-endopeptidase MepM/ murein hydrolase activator NlpD
MRDRSLKNKNGRIFLILGVFGVLVLTAAAGAAGFWYGHSLALEDAPSVKAVASLEAMVRHQRSAIKQVKEDSLTNIDALGERLGQMQAELLRLNALGERLVKMSGLSGHEFDFTDPPAMGGPEQPSATHTRVEELAEEMSHLFRELQDRESKLNLLQQMIMERRLDAQTMPEGAPIRSGYITSPFGYRSDPINGRREFHSGIDFAGKRGTDVTAVADGLVTFAGWQHGYGNTVEIRHGNGLVTRYGHNEKLLVKVGELVKKGQTIAELGSTGRSTGPHVHFEVIKDGKPVNPMKYVELGEDGKKS